MNTAGSQPDLAALSARIGYTFTDESLLRRSMAHRSWCAEVSGEVSNERLEFLGDAVLGWVIADVAYHDHQELPEGKLTDLRKSVVNANALAAVAEGIVAGGGTAMDPEVVAQLVARRGPASPVAQLTPREREVLELMAEGRSNQAIGERMFITQRAVEKHVTSIFTKLRLPADAGDHRRVLAVLAFLRQ